MTQFSLFGAEVSPPTLDDLDGVLLAGGHWVRAGDGSARLSVVVDDRWRAEALAAAYADRAVPADQGDGIVDENGMLAARTCFHDDLVYWAQRWTRGAREDAPPGLRLTAGGLRLWAITTGRRDEAGYLLGTAEADGSIHRAAGAQLAALGVAGVSIGVRGGPGWRVTSARRLRRLTELVGAAPRGAGVDWP
jgi:hypothetical protein